MIKNLYIKPNKITTIDTKVNSGSEEGIGKGVAIGGIGSLVVFTVVPLIITGVRSAQMTWNNTNAWMEKEVFTNMVPPYINRLHATTDAWSYKAELLKVKYEIDYCGQLHSDILAVDSITDSKERVEKLLTFDELAQNRGISRHVYSPDNTDYELWNRFHKWIAPNFIQDSNKSVSRVQSLINDNVNSQAIDNLIGSSQDIDRIRTDIEKIKVEVDVLRTDLEADRTQYQGIVDEMKVAMDAGDDARYDSLLLRSLQMKQIISDEQNALGQKEVALSSSETALGTIPRSQESFLKQISETAESISPILDSVGNSRVGGLATLDPINEFLLQMAQYTIFPVTIPAFFVGGYIGHKVDP